MTASSNANSLGTPMPLRPALRQLAYFRFVYDFVSSDDPDYTAAGAFESLPQMFTESTPNSPLHCAITAVSLANFGSRFKSVEATQQGAMCYGKALTAFATAMFGPREQLRTKEALLGIFFLGTYEVMTSPSFDGTFRMHQYGAASLLRDRWGDGTFNISHGNKFLPIIYTQLVSASSSWKSHSEIVLK